MNNNMNFDPMTGQPIQKNQTEINTQEVTQSNLVEQQINQQPNEQVIKQTTIVEQNEQQPISEQQINAQIQTQLQSIPTVEQNEQQFINNVQTMNQEKKEETKEGVNFVFIIVLFVIILAAIYFLFPLLSKYI